MSFKEVRKISKTSTLNALSGAAVAIFTLMASNDAEAQTQRNRLTLQDYCTQSVAILADRNRASEFQGFVANNTPFQANTFAEVPFSSNYGSVNVSVPAETFVVFCNPNKTEWTVDDVRLLETGGTLSAIHNSLGSYNARDPANITRIANLAAQDISIGSRYTEPMIDHMQNSHGMRIKVIANGQSADSPDLQALKENALQHLIP
ncbi:MAG: hypothetical protein ACK4VI_00200 [Alphaproteobacteria bacterium]